MDGLESPSAGSANFASSVACLNCRDKHLKCDGNQSGCSRCISLRLPCHFVPSRRGRKCRYGPYQTTTPLYLLPENRMPPSVVQHETGLSEFVALDPPAEQQQHQEAYLTCPARTAGRDPSVHLVSLYYMHFHQAHPFLPPMEVFLQSGPPKYLIDVVELISLHYISQMVPDCSGALVASAQAAEGSTEKVHAFLLLAILLHGRQQQQEARFCMAQAVQLALDLGLHRRETSDAMGIQDPVQAECLRRTWWEILVVDVLLAAVQVEGVLQLPLSEIPDVPLPGEEEDYKNGCLGRNLITVADMERQNLLCDGHFSSSTYRVEAALLLRKCLLAGETHISPESLDMLGATITGWFHRLPKSKRAILHPTGTVDEMMMQAMMLIHCASIYLHFPHSSLLAFLPITSQVFCSQPPLVSSNSLNPQLYTAKVAAAAMSLSKLASLSTSVANHTPFFVCVLNLSSILQVAVLAAECLEWSQVSQPYLSLNIGVLKSMHDTWPLAGSSMQRLREVVMEVQAAAPLDSQQLLESLPVTI